MADNLDLAELGALYSSLSAEERDELLQCLLVAASTSGETVIERLENVCQKDNISVD